MNTCIISAGNFPIICNQICFIFTEKKNIVCTSADNIVDLFGGAGTSAYTQWVASGKAGWAYLVTHGGNIDARDGTDQFQEAFEVVMGKLEFGTGLNWDGSIADTVNTFVWLRDMADQFEYCEEESWSDPECRPGGINIIHNQYVNRRLQDRTGIFKKFLILSVR